MEENTKVTKKWYFRLSRLLSNKKKEEKSQDEATSRLQQQSNIEELLSGQPTVSTDPGRDPPNEHGTPTGMQTEPKTTRPYAGGVCQDSSEEASFWISGTIDSGSSGTKYPEGTYPRSLNYEASSFSSKDFRSDADTLLSFYSASVTDTQISRISGSQHIQPKIQQRKHPVENEDDMSYTKPHVVVTVENDSASEKGTSITNRQAPAPDPSSSVALCQATQIPPQMGPVKPPSVFMTYAEEPARESHQQLIRCIANDLSRLGIQVHLDMHETVEMSSSICGWLDQNIYTCDFVIACVSPSYKSQVEQAILTPTVRYSERSLQSCYVYSCLATDYIDNCSRNRRFIPILVGGATREDLPNLYKNTIHYEWPTDIKKITFRLYGKEMYPSPKLGATPDCVLETHYFS